MSGIRETPAPAWQPIETAPKDATILIVCAASARDATFAGRRDVLPIYVDDEGQFDPDPSNEFWDVTHWMPLPEPPVTE